MSEHIKVMKNDRVQELPKKQIMIHPLWVQDRNEAGFNFRKGIFICYLSNTDAKDKYKS